MELGNPAELRDLEIQLLLEAVFHRYGFDFRDYAYSHLERRILRAVEAENLNSVSALQERVLHDPAAMDRFLLFMSVKVTSMFRDPAFYASFRSKVLPLLRTYPFVRIWDAGCATGEEVYSMAIMLEEEGLHDRCRIYATDLDEVALEQAKAGIYRLSDMQAYSSNYLQAGGKGSLSDYYTAQYDNAIFANSLKRNVVFARHNLATDGAFNVFHVVLCRNVMIYFGPALRDRVHKLLHDSLTTFGVLVLGAAETLRFTPVEPMYEEIDAAGRLYRRRP